MQTKFTAESNARRSFLYRSAQGAVGLGSAAIVGACGGGGTDATAAGTANNESAVKVLAFNEVAAAAVTMVTGGARSGSMRIAVREYGNPAGKPIVFIHGFSQNHLCWYRQLGGVELAGFRLIAIDLRGHGNSDKTLPAGFPGAGGYAPDDYADDIAAVIAAKGLVKPVLVGWSYGGWVICDYLRVHGSSNVGGLNFVGAACRLDQTNTPRTDFIGPGFVDTAPDLLSDDAFANMRGTINFLNACTNAPPSQDDFAMLLATNMLVPASVRLALFLRPDNRYDATLLSRMAAVPTLVTHGVNDKVVLVDSGRAIAAAVAGSQLSLYDKAGHSPFIEDSGRFNLELAALRARI